MVHNPLVSSHRSAYPSGYPHTLRSPGGVMAGRRTNLMDIRELLRHLQATSNVSAIHRATGLNRRTILRYQA